MNSEYRIESFYQGRPMTIWEMRNPTIIKHAIEMICDYNFDKNIRDKIMNIYPINQKNLQINTILNSWGNQLLEKSSVL